MDDILTVSQLIDELLELPPDAHVMVAVVKYPAEWNDRPLEEIIREDHEGNARWDLGTDVECHPLEAGEVTLQQGFVYLTVELEDYDEARRAHLKA